MKIHLSFVFAFTIFISSLSCFAADIPVIECSSDKIKATVYQIVEDYFAIHVERKGEEEKTYLASTVHSKIKDDVLTYLDSDHIRLVIKNQTDKQNRLKGKLNQKDDSFTKRVNCVYFQ